MHRPSAALSLLLLAACSSPPVVLRPVAAPQRATSAPSALIWGEHFAHPPLDWITPRDGQSLELPRVFATRTEQGVSFLHARHDATEGAVEPPRAIHYGKSFVDEPIAIARVRELRWRWRVLRHPAVTDDPWVDIAASVYVVMRMPGILPGRGFKFGWVASQAPEGTTQRGLAQIALRTGPPLNSWVQERIDLCRLTRESKGSCEDESILYIGVVTDADNTHSVAEADYADFELELAPPPAPR